MGWGAALVAGTCGGGVALPEGTGSARAEGAWGLASAEGAEVGSRGRCACGVWLDEGEPEVDGR